MATPHVRKLPFQGLKPHQWWRLAVVSMLVTYALISAANIKLLGLFNYVGLDFRTFYTSAQIAQTEGFAKVYELGRQQVYQLPLYESYIASADAPAFEPVPTPYFPVFILPFFVFLPFSPVVGFTLFSLLNLIGFVAYTRRLVRQFEVREEAGWVIAGALVSIPVFFNLFYGQVNLMLFIALGEFLLAAKRKRGFRSGLWLSLWLIKPQALVFILPWLLFSRRWRVLAGFGLGGLLVYVSSSLLAGWGWTITWTRLLVLYPQNLATTNPLAMMNWRSLALHFESLMPALFAWSIGLFGMSLTIFWAVRTWKKNDSSHQFKLAILANLAATNAVTWHAHTHMAMILLVPLIALLGNKYLSYKIWMGIIGVQFLGLVISIAAQAWFPANNLSSLVMLSVSVFLTYWSYIRFIANNHEL